MQKIFFQSQPSSLLIAHSMQLLLLMGRSGRGLEVVPGQGSGHPHHHNGAYTMNFPLRELFYTILEKLIIMSYEENDLNKNTFLSTVVAG